jgi:hypothetical protein
MHINALADPDFRAVVAATFKAIRRNEYPDAYAALDASRIYLKARAPLLRRTLAAVVQMNAENLPELTRGQLLGEHNSLGWEPAIGYVIGVAELAEASDLPFDEGELALAALRALPADFHISIVDMRDAVRSLAAHGRLADWYCPEDAERPHVRSYDYFLSLLRSRPARKWMGEIVRAANVALWVARQLSPADRQKLLDLLESRRRAALECYSNG